MEPRQAHKCYLRGPSGGQVALPPPRVAAAISPAAGCAGGGRGEHLPAEVRPAGRVPRLVHANGHGNNQHHQQGRPVVQHHLEADPPALPRQRMPATSAGPVFTARGLDCFCVTCHGAQSVLCGSYIRKLLLCESRRAAGARGAQPPVGPMAAPALVPLPSCEHESGCAYTDSRAGCCSGRWRSSHLT